MATPSLARRLPATRKMPALFGQHGARRIVESPRTERMCDFLRASLAESDGHVSGEEDAAIRASADRVSRVLGSIVLTADVSAGLRLAGEAARS